MYTTIYEDTNGTEWFQYDWKPNHEYIVFTIAAYKGIELDSCRFFTFAQGITPQHRGYMMRTIDGYLVMDQVTKGFRSVPDTARCPIVKILERPLNFGAPSPTDDNDNWDLFFTADGTKNPLVPWEDDYEYVVCVAGYYNLGPYYGTSWVSPGYAFIDSEQRDISTNTLFWRKETNHIQVLDGYVSFVLAEIGAGNSGTVQGRRLKCYWDANMIGVFQIFRRKIRKLTEADSKYNGWKVVMDALPAGRQIGSKWNEAIPFAWENDKEYRIIYSDPWGDCELSSGIFYVDSIVDNAALKARWNWNLFAVESGSSAPIALAPTWFNNKNYRQLFSWGEWGPRVFRIYERLPRLDPPIVLPDPDPPQQIPCADRCYIVGDVWEQICTVEVRFVDPPDWQQREYEYEWGGDLGKGLIELVETLEGGRIAKIRLVKTLEATDHESTLPVTINVTVIDKKYQQLGMKDSDDAILTFELPCVIEGNSPQISIEDLSIVELDANRSIDVRVFLNEAYVGSTPMCVDWKTVDGTATSDLSVKALALDDNGKPFITVIENLAGDRRVYIDGAFPKFYNLFYNQRNSDQAYMNTLIFAKNIITWLTNGKTRGKVLLMGDDVFTGPYRYDVKTSFSDPDGSVGFKDYFTDATTQLGVTLEVRYNTEIAADPAFSQTYFDQFDCVIYFSSNYTATQQNPTPLLTALKASHFSGLGIAVIGDHGDDSGGGPSFSKGGNEILFDFYGIRLKGSEDRGQMNITVENVIAQKGNHPLWTGMSGRINSGNTEAYVDATDQTPDYVAASGTVCFNSGDQEKTIQIQIIGDNEIENNEQFTIELSNNTKGTIAKAVGTITIQDDDAEPCGVATPSGGEGVTETWHYLGPDAGYLTISYNMYQQPDGMEVFYEGQLVGTTGGFVSNTGEISFFYPGPPNDTRCLIRVTGSGTGTAWDYQLNCPAPVPTQLAYIYGTSVEADSKMATYVPETQQSIFDSWARTDGNDLYANEAAAPVGSAAKAWQLVGGNIVMPDNLSSYTAFVSPQKYSNYTFAATVSSPDADDDLMGLLVGSAVGQDGILRTITVARTGGGMRHNPTDVPPVPYTFGLFFVENGSVTGMGVVKNVGSPGNWDGQKARIEVVRNGNIITARTTLFYTGASPGFEPTSLIEIDLTSDPAYAPFLNESHYGYMVRSQAGANFSEIIFTGDVTVNKIYDVERNATFVYDEQASQWSNVGRTIQVDAGYPLVLKNPETNNQFFIAANNITSA